MTLVCSASMSMTTQTSSPMGSVHDRRSRGAHAASQALALDAAGMDGNQHRLTGLYIGRECFENAIETHQSKLRQYAAEREAVGSRRWLAHRPRILPRLRKKWAKSQEIARDWPSWHSALFCRPGRESWTPAAQLRGPHVSRHDTCGMHACMSRRWGPDVGV